jgi:U4/U6 small nuclear ribonucleoprotein PRP3
MRKLRRKAELQDKRDRIRMGLLPPDPPKGKPKDVNAILMTTLTNGSQFACRT